MSRNRNRRRTEVELATTPSDQARPVTRRGTIQDLWWLIFGGCLTFLAFPYRTTPDSEIWPLAWVGLVPLLWTLQGVTPRRALFYGALCGFVINFGGFWWMSGMFEEFGHLPAAVAWGLTILNAFYQGLLIALFSYAVVWLGRRHHRLPGPLVIASAFTAIEYLFPMVFPWYYGNSQHPFRTFVQVADLAGVYGVSFLVVLGNALIASGFGRLRGYEIHRIQAGVGVGLLALAIGYGVVRLGEVDAAAESAPTLKIGMVEADIGIWEKEAKGLAPDERRRTLHSNLLKHQEMSRDLARRGAELILWPESSYLPLGPVYGKRTDAFAAGIGPGGRLALWRDLGDAGFDWSLGPVLNTSGGPMRALAAARENAMCAVGDNGYAAYWDGRRLTRLPIQLLDDSPPPALLGVAVGAPAGLRADADGVDPLIWAVGERGHAYTGDLHGLDLVATELSTALRGVVTIGQGRALAVGDRGVILALEGRAHTRVETNSQADLHAIAFDSQDKVLWAVGAEGTILTARGANWSRERSGVTSLLRSVTVTPEGVVYAVGDHGTVLRRDRSGSWIQEALSTKADLLAVSCDARGKVMAADKQGGLWVRGERPGEGWRRMDAPGIGPLHSLTSLDYVRMRPIPKDARYLMQSATPGPSPESFMKHPRGEMTTRSGVRTAVQRGFTTPIIFGAITWKRGKVEGSERGRRVWNTAVMLDEMGRIRGMYDKYQLLAFGEYIPFGDWFPSLYGLIPEAGRFTAGDDVGTFDYKGHTMGIMICYEDILTRFAARLAGLGPNVLLNITNDAWFGRTSEPYLHLNLAIMRAIETHRPLLRSTNTGISTVVDPAGRLVHQTSIDDAETLLADVPMMSIETLYARIGDLFAHVTLVHMLCLFLMRRKRREA